MPKIREYGAPELGYQRDGVTSTARYAPDGESGRAISRFGEHLTDLGDSVYRRQEQEETSNINAEFSTLSADVTTELDEQVRDGTINAQEYAEKLQERINKFDQNIETGAGRRSFERNSAQLQSQAFKRASRGQAIVAGARAEANVKTEMGNYSSSLFNDPGNFDVYHQRMFDSIDDQVETGALKASDAEKLKYAAGSDLAKSAVRGWAQLDPNVAEQKLTSGEFDRYFDGDTKAQMQGYINQQRTAGETEKNRVEAQIKKAEKARTDAWYETNLSKIIQGNLDTKQIMNSPLKPREKMSLLRAVNANAIRGGTSNPRVVNYIRQRILLPAGDPYKIVDVQQFIDRVGIDLSMTGLGKLNSFLQKTPEGQAMVDKERRLMDFAKKGIANRGFMSSGFGTDINSEKNISQFMDDYQAAKQAMIKEGKNPSALVDPNSKEHYFGNKISAYRLSGQQVVDNLAEETKKRVQVETQAKVSGEKRIKVISPDGIPGTIFESEKQKKLSEGYRLRGD